MKIVISAAYVYALCLLSFSAWASSPPMLNCALIIEPGHGGEDKGAPIRDNIHEAEINLDIARHLSDYVSRLGVRVYMTRNAEAAERGLNDSEQRVNRAYARALEDGVPHENIALIALHADALYNDNLSGTLIYIPEPKFTQGNSVRLLREKARSQHFAETLLKQLRNDAERFPVYHWGEPIRSVMRKPSKVYSPAVLRDTFPPVRILVEAGNSRNAADLERLMDPFWRRAFAQAISETYAEHFLLPTARTKTTLRMH